MIKIVIDAFGGDNAPSEIVKGAILAVNKNDDILKIELENDKTLYVCTICGYVYEGEELPEDFVCPICFASRELFEKKMK